ncbi:MAG: hypothetical protein E7643_07300 [Ruminococcaceae bacterium]|nr:hypothetical protein [Oscillospiraceae bacterium]
MLSLSEIKKTMQENNLIVSILSEYINNHPRFLTADTVSELANECNVSQDDAFRILLCAACGLDTAAERWHRRLEQRYFVPGLHKLSPDTYREDLYNRTVHFPSVRLGKWELCKHSYHPYQPFVCNHPILTREFCEIPQIGYFDEEFFFPAVLENGIEWMTVTPNEVETMKAPIKESHGRVVTLGLGLGYFAFHASEKCEVESVTVVERDKDVISLFKEYLLPQFPNREKITILETDAFEFMKKEPGALSADYLFADLWHDASDGLDMYLELKKFEKDHPETKFSYWIEPSLLSVLRQMVFERITDPVSPLQLRGVSPEKLLSDNFLKTLNLTKEKTT